VIALHMPLAAVRTSCSAGLPGVGIRQVIGDADEVGCQVGAWNQLEKDKRAVEPVLVLAV
jgi:hypothetical protein